ncbi:TolC family protein [Psychrobacter frigidicola]|uniref:TolC family protein n=1 Tax=Psychrobacter frigidicola TaxID=45611 RepID=A0A5C7ABC9_9GAMM|nr:TolC family protein [Psychrobacter frigidicola]TXD98163.1 TolC family protein [Psychrobacter frigidicola]
MKFALSSLSTAMLAGILIGLSNHTLANINSEAQSIDKQYNELTPIAAVQANEGVVKNTAVQQKNALNLSTLTDPITHKRIDNSYPLEVSSFLSLEQAQNILLQVSPKLAANQAAIAASNYQTDALKTIDNPFVFAQVSASAYSLQADIDLSTLKNGVVNGVNNAGADIGANVGAIIPPTPNLPNFGELIGERIPDSYNLKRSGTRTGAGVGVAWPVYTAGRTTALTGLSDARTQEALADSVLDKNELYNTLIERYFKAQLAIIAAYLREDAYDTLQQTDHMAKRLFEEGFISRVERLEAQSALADANSEAVNANNDARLAMIALQRLLRTDYPIKPTTPLFLSSRQLPDVTYFQELALHHHPGLQKVAAKRAQAQQLHALSDTGYKPTVMLYGYGQVEEKPSWVAGVSASWKLWGGLDKTATLASSTAKIRQADLSEIELSDNLLLLVEKNWHDVNNAQSRYQALQSNVDLSAEVLRLRRLGLQEGVNTTVDVVQAQTQALKARTEQAQAANNYVQGLAALMQSCGTPLAFNAYLNAADIRLTTLYEE